MGTMGPKVSSVAMRMSGEKGRGVHDVRMWHRILLKTPGGGVGNLVTCVLPLAGNPPRVLCGSFAPVVILLVPLPLTHPQARNHVIAVHNSDGRQTPVWADPRQFLLENGHCRPGAFGTRRCATTLLTPNPTHHLGIATPWGRIEKKEEYFESELGFFTNGS